jgi:flagellar motor switch protein FliN
MAEIKPGTPLHLLAEPFRQAINDALAQATPSWKVIISGDDAPASDDKSAPLCFAVSASGGLTGNAAFEVRNADALLLAQRLLSETADPAAELSANHKQAVEEFLRKVTAAVATSLKGQFGEVALQVNAIDTPSWRGASVAFLAAEGASSITLKLQFDSELLASTRPPAAEEPVATAPAAPAKPVSTGDSHLDLLLGVDLSLTLRFGQRTLTLREILELTSGSIIELDRQVQEPADLLLGDKLIARGEVVIVDGNYGLRITEVSDQPVGSDRMGMAAGR